MGTVGSALTALIWPVVLAVLAALLLSIAPLLGAAIRFLRRGPKGDLAKRSVDLAEAALERGKRDARGELIAESAQIKGSELDANALERGNAIADRLHLTHLSPPGLRIPGSLIKILSFVVLASRPATDRAVSTARRYLAYGVAQFSTISVPIRFAKVMRLKAAAERDATNKNAPVTFATEFGQDGSGSTTGSTNDSVEDRSQVFLNWLARVRVRKLSTLLRVLALLMGLTAAVWVGVVVLYIPMVSTSYQALYSAYCRGDAVASVVSERSGSGNLISFSSFNGCVKDNPPDGAPGLGHDEIFYLLDRLGLRDPRERTSDDLFNGDGDGTPNRKLAKLLSDKGMYVVGTPATTLVTRLAAQIGSPKDRHAPGDPGADDAVCRTAGLAAALAQQPIYLDGGEHPIGRMILVNNGFPLAVLLDPNVSTLLSRQQGYRVTEVSDKGTVTLSDGQSNVKVSLHAQSKTCIGDAELASHGLGPGFLATIRSTWSSRIPLLNRPTDRLTDGEIVTIALDWVHYQPPASAADRASDQAILDFMRNIVSEASALSDVRQGRIAVNFFIGWERLAILIVSTFLVLCLLWQQASIVDDQRHFQYIAKVVKLARSRYHVLTLALAFLRQSLYWSIGRSAPREVLDAAIEMVEQKVRRRGSVDRDRLRRTAEHELRIMDRGRIFFLVGLPLLPTIGFIGTVRSLIEALGIADNIPRARDAVSQVAAVADVTSTLSLCFSTTFMALLALLILAPLDLWQSTHERKVVEETERLLDDSVMSEL